MIITSLKLAAASSILLELGQGSHHRQKDSFSLIIAWPLRVVVEPGQELAASFEALRNYHRHHQKDSSLAAILLWAFLIVSIGSS